MAHLVKHKPSDKNCDEFKNILLNQDFIEDFDLHDHYSTETMYLEICEILKKDKYFKEKSFLKSVS